MAAPTEPQTVFDLETLNQRRVRDGGPWLEFLNVDSMYCGVYQLAAGSEDKQSPHAEDEIYFVHSGKSEFRSGDQVVAVRPGMILFVPAGESHKFFNITDDLTLLVVFSKAPVADK